MEVMLRAMYAESRVFDGIQGSIFHQTPKYQASGAQ